MLDPELLLWLLVLLQGSVKQYFPLFPFTVWSVLQTHAHSVRTLTFTQNVKSSHVVAHVPSLSRSCWHAHDTSLNWQTHFFFTQQGHSQFPPNHFSWEEWLLWGRRRERERKLPVCQHYIQGCRAQKDFWLSGIAMATYCTFVHSRGTLKLFLS